MMVVFESDPEKIKKLSEMKERENLRFRSFLKSGRIPEDRIDSVSQEIYRTISSQIDCRECANCCIALQPILDADDVKRLSLGLGMKEADLTEKYLTDGDEKGSYMFNATPCPFLRDRSCTVYPHRPGECRSFPHVDNKEIHGISIDMIYNSSICPIIYHFLEGLKHTLRFD